MLFNGEVALITGAGRGIGRAIALCFAGEGAKTVLTGRNMDRLELVAHEIQAAGGESASYSLDVTRDDDAGRVVEEVIRKWGHIDVLVNNAGVISYDKPLWDTTMEQWDEVMNTNLRGMHLASRAVIPHMMRRKDGVIINIGFVLGAAARQRIRGIRNVEMGCRGIHGFPGPISTPLRNQGEWHQPRLGGYRYGTSVQSFRRPGMDCSGRGSQSRSLPGGAGTRHDDRAHLSTYSATDSPLLSGGLVMNEVPDFSESFYRRNAQRYAEVSHNFIQSVYTDMSHQKLGSDRDLMDRMMELFPPGSRGLDAGCGAGARDVYFYWQNGYDICGVDAVEENILEARRLHPEIADVVEVADLGQTLSYPDGSFDFVLCNAVIQHIEPAVTMGMTLPELARVLKPGGVLQLMFKYGTVSQRCTTGLWCGQDFPTVRS